MKQFSWEEAITELERTSRQLLAALPVNTPLIENALQRREAIVQQIQALTALPDKEQLARLQDAAALGESAAQQLLLAREQIRDSIARLNHASYLSQAFAKTSPDLRKSFDCEG